MEHRENSLAYGKSTTHNNSNGNNDNNNNNSKWTQKQWWIEQHDNSWLTKVLRTLSEEQNQTQLYYMILNIMDNFMISPAWEETFMDTKKISLWMTMLLVGFICFLCSWLKCDSDEMLQSF